MKPWKVIQKLESDNSRLVKEAIIRDRAKENNDEFFAGVKLALTSTITFGIKKVPTKTGGDGPGLDFGKFTGVVNKFIKRTLTGNAAQLAVQELMDQATVEQWNDWYRRILIKDLRCGVSEKTINNVVKKHFPAEYQVPVFSCQLAHDGANHQEKVSGEKMIEVKLDGVRVITIVHPDGNVDQFSRNGKELVNFPHIKLQFAKASTVLTEPTVFDGEVMSSSFQDLMKQVHRKSNVQSTDAVLHLFDVLSLKEFMAGKSKTKQVDRSAKLMDWYLNNAHQLTNVQVLSHTTVDLDTPAGQKEFARINAQAIRGGYEGIMIKDPNAPYQCKRSTAWLKQKPFIEVSLEVVDIEEGTGRNAGRLGALVCEGEDDGKTIRVNVGSGYSDDQRDEYWINKKKVKGMIAEVRADVVTQNQDGSYSLRFPRFLRFRGFKAGEKL